MRAWKLLEVESLYKIQSEVLINFLESHSTMRWLLCSSHSENLPADYDRATSLDRVLMPEACTLTSSEVGVFHVSGIFYKPQHRTPTHTCIYQFYSLKGRHNGTKLVCKEEMGTTVVMSSLPKLTEVLANTGGPGNRPTATGNGSGANSKCGPWP